MLLFYYYTSKSPSDTLYEGVEATGTVELMEEQIELVWLWIAGYDWVSG